MKKILKINCLCLYSLINSLIFFSLIMMYGMQKPASKEISSCSYEYMQNWCFRQHFCTKLDTSEISTQSWKRTTQIRPAIESNRRQKIMDDYALEIYKEQIKQRKSIIQTINPETATFLDLYPVISVPEVICLNLIRIGRVQDGGKWVCNVKNAIIEDDDCIVYSLGLNNEISFEEHFNNITENKCKFRLVDKDNQESKVLDRLKQFNTDLLITTIASNTSLMENKTNIPDIIKHFGDDQMEMEILKIDIEGAEIEVVDQFLQYPFCQILIELHIQKPYDLLKLLQKISRAGYYLFASENNPVILWLREYAWINEKCLTKYGLSEGTVLGKYLS